MTDLRLQINVLLHFSLIW